MNQDKLKRMLSPERMARFDSDKLMAELNLSGIETVVDAGAGPGAFTFLFAESLPKGRVYAIDIDQSLLDIIDAHARETGIKNVTTVHAEKIDIAASTADKVFCCTVLHEVAEKEAFLSQYFNLLKSGGEMLIVEFTSGRRTLDEDDTVRRTFISSERTCELMRACGFADVVTEAINPLIYLARGVKP